MGGGGGGQKGRWGGRRAGKKGGSGLSPAGYHPFLEDSHFLTLFLSTLIRFFAPDEIPETEIAVYIFANKPAPCLLRFQLIFV